MENLEKFKELVKGKKFFSEELERKIAKLFENVVIIILKDNTFDNTLMIENIKYYERKVEENEL